MLFRAWNIRQKWGLYKRQNRKEEKRGVAPLHLWRLNMRSYKHFLGLSFAVLQGPGSGNNNWIIRCVCCQGDGKKSCLVIKRRTTISWNQCWQVFVCRRRSLSVCLTTTAFTMSNETQCRAALSRPSRLQHQVSSLYWSSERRHFHRLPNRLFTLYRQVLIKIFAFWSLKLNVKREEEEEEEKSLRIFVLLVVAQQLLHPVGSFFFLKEAARNQGGERNKKSYIKNRERDRLWKHIFCWIIFTWFR